MARIKYYNRDTGDWEYADSLFVVGDANGSSENSGGNILFVDITKDENSNYVSSHSASEIKAHLENGGLAVARYDGKDILVHEIAEDYVSFAYTEPSGGSGARYEVYEDKTVVVLGVGHGDSGGNVDYTLPVANANTLGGVKPMSKTEQMTHPVGVDADGRLWSIPADDTPAPESPPAELPTDGLIMDLHTVDGVVTDTVTDIQYTNFPVRETDGWFGGDANKYGTQAGTNVLPQTVTNRTVIFLMDRSEGADSNGSVLYPNGQSMYGIQSGVLNNGLEEYFRDFAKSLSPINFYTYPGGTFVTTMSNAKLAVPYNTYNNPALMFFGLSLDIEAATVNQVFCSAENVQTYTDGYTDLESLYIPASNTRFARMLVYDRALSQEEMMYIRDEVFGITYDNFVSSKLYTQGMTGLGSSSAFHAQSGNAPIRQSTPIESGEHTVEVDDTSITFTNVDHANPVCEETMSKFTALMWTNPISEIKAGDVYNIEAFPYPYKIDDADYLYHVEYSTSAPEVLECYDGVLIAKSAGSATITAKIANVDISTTLEITVTEPAAEPDNMCYLPDRYMYGVHALDSDNPVSVLRAICGAIKEAAADGYDGIVFPKRDYHVKPFAKVCCFMPSNFIVDFNGASMYVHDSDFVQAGAAKYTMFAFGWGSWGDRGEFGLYTPCHNCTVRNLNYYGERYWGQHEDGYYSEFINSFVFGAGGVSNCRIENVNFDSTTGFNISSQQTGFMQWQGTGLDGARRGCTVAADYVAGRLNETGITVQDDATGMWYSTPELLKLGYQYADAPKENTDMKYYCGGRMGTATRQGIGGWWYDIWFFDENKSLIEYAPCRMALERYLLPEKAVYFKVAVASWGAPTDSTDMDVVHAFRIWNVTDPVGCYIDNCRFVNPHASAVSWTGGHNCIMRDIYAEQGAFFYNPSGYAFGWSIDYEDGWLAMRHNVCMDTLCSGLAANPGGYDTAYLNCCINSVTAGGSAQEAIKLINCTVSSINCSAKTNDLYNNVTYGKMTTNISSDVAVASVRKVNCTENTAMKLF